jgi:hypothetical protein
MRHPSHVYAFSIVSGAGEKVNGGSRFVRSAVFLRKISAKATNDFTGAI